jgi:hypothetical protein
LIEAGGEERVFLMGNLTLKGIEVKWIGTILERPLPPDRGGEGRVRGEELWIPFRDD